MYDRQDNNNVDMLPKDIRLNNIVKEYKINVSCENSKKMLLKTSRC